MISGQLRNRDLMSSRWTMKPKPVHGCNVRPFKQPHPSFLCPPMIMNSTKFPNSNPLLERVVLITKSTIGYWITEYLKNTMHSVVAGVYGSWFFCGGKPGGMPKGATRGAFRRAMTYSFGSISFGSLVVAIINMLRQAVSIAQQTEASQGNMIASILFCCLGCLVGLLQWAVQ